MVTSFTYTYVIYLVVILNSSSSFLQLSYSATIFELLGIVLGIV